jgi:hypothetical protein
VVLLRCADHRPIRIRNEWEQLITASPVMAKSWAPAGGNNYPKNGLVKPPRRDKRTLSPAGMFEENAPLRLVAQKSRPRAPLAHMRSTPAYFRCKWDWRLDWIRPGPARNQGQLETPFFDFACCASSKRHFFKKRYCAGGNKY